MRYYKYFFSTLALVFVIACHQAPIMNIESTPIVTTSPTTTKIENAIQKAALSLNWKPRKVAPGLIEATLFVRSHKAVVEIPYSTKTYSIRYKSSENLKYDGKTIHSFYNSWVQNLDRAIQRELI